jgi:thiol-disulfide isomerase/thioredoxin
MGLAIGTLMPSFDGATEWISGDSETAYIKGHPALVQFWSVSCPACKAGMPKVLEMLTEYREQGLQLISIHLPRSPHEHDVDAIKAVAQKMGVTGTSAIDSESIIGKAFQTNGHWPSYFFFDARGVLRARAAGGTGLRLAENSLKRILDAEAKKDRLPGQLAAPALTSSR